jgi:murein DD-endopeptidase MepM/ murein hydrolase activator NlpD
VKVGQHVAAGTAIGELLTGHSGCPAPACLHWGAMWGPASRADYVDPLGLLASTPIRLKPLHR